jgi:hypothetical protein
MSDEMLSRQVEGTPVHIEIAEFADEDEQPDIIHRFVTGRRNARIHHTLCGESRIAMGLRRWLCMYVPEHCRKGVRAPLAR